MDKIYLNVIWEWVNLANTLPVNLAKLPNQSIWRFFLRDVKVATVDTAKAVNWVNLLKELSK